MSREKNYTGLIPPQEEGVVVTAETDVTVNDKDDLRKVYEESRQRLLEVNKWQSIAGPGFGNFQLTDARGVPVDGEAREGYHFRIDIPGPGSKAGEGYDWVNVEAIRFYDEGDVQSVAMRVRPATDPTNHSEATAHFYDEVSTSTFTITREKNKLTAAVYDRNTRPNRNSDNVVDGIRNAVVGVFGLMAFSKIEWKQLTSAILKRSDAGNK